MTKLPKLYRVVTMGVPIQDWNWAGGDWVDSNYDIRVSARRVLCPSGWKWSVVDVGSLYPFSKEVLSYLEEMNDHEIMDDNEIIVSGPLYSKDYIISGQYTTIEESRGYKAQIDADWSNGGDF